MCCPTSRPRSSYSSPRASPGNWWIDAALGTRYSVRPVETLDDPRLAVYRSLRRVSELRKEGTFVAEGGRLVAKLLRSPLRVHSLLTDQRWLDELRPLLEARPETDLPVFLTTRPELERIIGFHVHQGVMAVADAPRPTDLFELARTVPDPVFVALAGVASHDNVGGIVRTAAGFGAAGVLIDGATCDPYVRRAARASMGAIFELPIWRTQDLPATIRALRSECGTRALAAHVHEPCEALDRTDLSGSVLLVLGAEGHGVPDDVVAACDASVVIPMTPGFDCFNVATAGAIVLYEITRRRRES